MPVIRGASGFTKLEDNKLVIADSYRLPLGEVNVDLVLSWLAACAARKIIEETGFRPLEVRIDAYADIDKLLEGAEEIEYLLVVAVYPKGVEAPSGEEVLKAVFKCPVVSLFREKIKGALIERKG